MTRISSKWPLIRFHYTESEREGDITESGQGNTLAAPNDPFRQVALSPAASLELTAYVMFSLSTGKAAEKENTCVIQFYALFCQTSQRIGGSNAKMSASYCPHLS
jgi:hypothetical protein